MDCTTKIERLCHGHHHACSDPGKCHGHHENAAGAFVSSWSSRKGTLQDSLSKLKRSTRSGATKCLQWPCKKHLHCQLGPAPFPTGWVNHLDNHHCAEVEVANAMAYLAPFFHVLWMLCHNLVRNVHVLYGFPLCMQNFNQGAVLLWIRQVIICHRTTLRTLGILVYWQGS